MVWSWQVMSQCHTVHAVDITTVACGFDSRIRTYIRWVFVVAWLTRHLDGLWPHNHGPLRSWLYMHPVAICQAIDGATIRRQQQQQHSENLKCSDCLDVCHYVMCECPFLMTVGVWAVLSCSTSRCPLYISCRHVAHSVDLGAGNQLVEMSRACMIDNEFKGY